MAGTRNEWDTKQQHGGQAGDMSRERLEAPSERPGHAIPAPTRGAGATLADDEALYDENVAGLYAFIYSKVGQRETAQDLTADVFVKAFAHLDRRQPRESIRAWLYKVARTTVADYWRARLRARVIPLEEVQERLYDPGERPGEAPHPDHLIARARAVLGMLPARYQEVLTLRFLRGYTLRETAAALGLSEGNVKVLQHRALGKARNLAEEETEAHNGR